MSQMRQTTTANLPPSEAAILGRLVGPEKGDLTPQAARALLNIRFGQTDQQRMNELAEKNRGATLTGDEQAEMEGYRRVGSMLAVLWSKARVSLKAAGMDADGHGP